MSLFLPDTRNYTRGNLLCESRLDICSRPASRDTFNMVMVAIGYDTYPEFLQLIGRHPKDDNTSIIEHLEPSLA